jgi:hypothetical protein
LIKTDGSGNEQWSKTLGGWTGDSVQQTADGGFIIAGSEQLSGFDVYLVKTNGSGNEQWSKTFGGSDSDGGSSVQQTADDGFIIAGSTRSFGPPGYNVYLIKTDGSGNEQWSKTLGGSSWDEGNSVQQTTDGGFIIAGATYSTRQGLDVYLIKTDGSGNELWSKNFGGRFYENGYSVQQTADGGFIIAGETTSFGAGLGDVYLIKTDGTGNEQWSKTFGGSDDDLGRSVQQTADGGFIIAGTTGYNEAFQRYPDVYLIKTDGSGNEQWSKTFGESSFDNGYSVQQTADGGYVIVGETSSFGAGQSDVYLIYYMPDDIVIANQTLNSIQSFVAYETITAGPAVAVNRNGDVIFQAGERVILKPGFSVEDGGRLSVIIDPTTGTLP